MAQGLVPPHNLEAEQSVLGCMLLSGDCVSDAISGLHEEDFYSPAHRVIFVNMSKLFAMSQPVDLVTLCDKLAREGALEGVGGAAYISQLTQAVPAVSNLPTYLDIVRDRALLRALMGVGGKLATESQSAAKGGEELLEQTESQLFSIAKSRESNGLMQIQPAVFNVYDQISEAFNHQGALRGVDTGYHDLNLATSGFNRSDLILIGARPSVGKTSIMLNFLMTAAIKNQVPCAFFSLEMSREQLVTRMMSLETSISQTALRRGELRGTDFDKLSRAMSVLGQAPVYIDDTTGMNPAQMLSKCRRMKMRDGLGLVFVDYLQLMSGNTQTDNRVQEVSEISRGLKKLARDLDVPVIAASQLSRANEQRRDSHKPRLSDLRDSGAIEQDADMVMFLHREHMYNPEADPNGAELIIAKQRNGPLADVQLRFQPELTRFYDADKQPNHGGF